MFDSLSAVRAATDRARVVSGLLGMREYVHDSATLKCMLDDSLKVLEADLAEREEREKELSKNAEDKARNISAHVANRIQDVNKSIEESKYPVTTDAGKVRDALLAAMLAKDMLRELAGNPAMPEAVEACAELIITSLTDCLEQS